MCRVMCRKEIIDSLRRGEERVCVTGRSTGQKGSGRPKGNNGVNGTSM